MIGRPLAWILLVSLGGCARAGAARAYSEPAILFLSPDSAGIEAMKARLGDDFYTVADDAMWYRAEAFSLLDSLGVEYEVMERAPLRFRVEGEPREYRWAEVGQLWFAVLYDGVREPALSFGADLRADLERFTKARDTRAGEP